ncbi:MAG: hypothetical protein PHC34_12520 [Candidatus Gastranaerophilales bacterium]|nr:hypothetical protein [Candidatus Gastranaerophilales bacterium]
MPTCRIKVYNPNPYDISVKVGDTATGAPSSNSLVRAGKTESFGFAQGKWLFYDRTTKNRPAFLAGQIQFDNQMFTIPHVPN